MLCQSSYVCPASPTNSDNFGTACLYSKQNGFSTAGNQSVTVSGNIGIPPAVPGLKTSAYWVTVETKQMMRTTFLSFLDATSMDVRARATAVLTGTGDTICIYVMDPALGGAMTMGGSADIQATCGVYVNSNSSTALTATGSANLLTTVTDVVGSTSLGGSPSMLPAPTNGAPVMSDPLASLPPPTFSGCDKTSFSSGGGTVTLNPGVYCNGITINNGTVNFNPGVYILNGGGLTISGSSNVTGAGVMFYNTAAGYTYGPIAVSGGTNTSLVAPTSGTYQGILFFQDRSITSSLKNSISGGSNLGLSGTVYMPTGPLSFSGGSTTTPLTMAIVCKTLSVTGGAYMSIDPTGTKTGIGKISVALVQ